MGENRRAEAVEAQLHRETMRFANEARNVHVDDDARVVHLSSIYVWYEQDYTSWLAAEHPDIPDPGLLDYVLLYIDEPARSAVQRARDGGYEIRAIPYDWGLNDQAPHR